MTANVQGTMATGSNPVAGNTSDSLPVPTGTTTLKLTTQGVNASNTLKSQMRTAGGTWADQVTYSTEQTATPITVAAGQEWRLVGVTQQAFTALQFKLSAES